MSIYDWEININNKNDSHTLILDYIEPNTTVLEFGSSTGAMTAYMSQNKKCDVYIVEYDKEAFENARKYAKDGVCADIDQINIEALFPGVVFDYVICADVLEHLRNPQKVLRESKKRLSDDGHFLISVPNIGYNGVIPELIDNRFHYRKNGVLDATHCHFFSYQSIIDMIYEMGYSILDRKITYMDVSKSEFSESWKNTPASVKRYLETREYGTAYQFVFNTVPRVAVKPVEVLSTSLAIDKICITCSGSNGSKVESYVMDDKHEFEVNMNITEDVSKILFNPSVNKKCVVSDLNVLYDGKKIEPKVLNGYEYKNMLFFDTENPVIEINGIEKSADLIIQCKINYYSSEDFDIVWKQTQVIANLEAMVENFSKEKEYLADELQAMQVKLEDIFKEKKYLIDELEELQETAETIEQNNRQLNDLVGCLKNEKMEREAQYQVLQEQFDEMANSTCWRMTGPFRRILDSIKHVLRSNQGIFLLKKVIATWRSYGLKAVVLRVKQYFDKKQEIKQLQETGYVIQKTNDIIPYDSEYQDNEVYGDSSKTDVKALAFYLPQFHSFPENDEWWGKGFTEWNNTTKAVPRFDGHYQPRTPHSDIGYYDLSDFETMRKQIELAKQHGLYGFCFYYYWFSGKRLMEKPVDMLLEHPEVDFPFCLCWANENWTRAWDGQTRNVLIAQEYSEADDNNFMVDMKKYIDDSRYIRINGKPLVIVYNPGQIPDCKKTFARWRECAMEIGIGEILIWTCQTANNTAKNLGIEECIDAEMEFPPHNMWFSEIGIRDLDLHGKSACIYNYGMLADIISTRLLKQTEPEKVPMHHSCMMGWDNSARRADNWTTYYGYSLHAFYKWLRALIQDARRKFPEEERFIFVNAWNEWAEGTYLEPDEKYGYANINTFSKAIFDLPFEDKLLIISEETEIEDIFKDDGEKPRIAVQVHMFYMETVEDIICNLNKIPYRFDCFVSTNTSEKAGKIREIFKEKCHAENVYVEVFANRGRDVAPFLLQMKNVIHEYDYIGHIHSKKTKTGDYGDGWREYLFRHLFGEKEYLKKVFCYMEKNSQIGLVFPETYSLLIKQAEWGGNKEECKKLLEKLKIQRNLPDNPVFPVGNMFWAKTAVVSSLFDADFSSKDFPKEAGQTNLTLGHQIERIWVYIAEHAGCSYKKIYNNYNGGKIDRTTISRLTIFVHYDPDNIISENDVKYVERLREISSKLIFVTNSLLPELEKNKVKPLVQEIMERDNNGYDFGAWKDAILKEMDSINEYDELVLTNNSLILTKIPFEAMFDTMEKQKVDFWGVTEFPYLPNGEFINKSYIPKHIQSYFQVFTKNAFTSDAFIDFWRTTGYYNDYQEVVGNQETQLTEILEKAGLKSGIYLKNSDLMCKLVNNFSLPFEYPYEMCVLGSPFVKKKALMLASDEEIIKTRSFMEQ